MMVFTCVPLNPPCNHKYPVEELEEVLKVAGGKHIDQNRIYIMKKG